MPVSSLSWIATARTNRNPNPSMARSTPVRTDFSTDLNGLVNWPGNSPMNLCPADVSKNSEEIVRRGELLD